jgi:hypothetical protein
MGRLSPRYFALSCNFEEVVHPVVDIRLLASVDKRLILDDSLVIAARLPEACRRPFAEWLGRRLARYAFPDDLERDLLRHLRQRVYVRYDSNQADGPLVRHIVGLFVNQMDRTVRLLFLVEPGARTIPQLNDDQKAQQAVRQLLGPIYTCARENGWQLDAVVHEPSELNAFDLLYGYQQVELDFPQAQVSD